MKDIHMTRKFAEYLAHMFDMYPLFLIYFPPEDEDLDEREPDSN